MTEEIGHLSCQEFVELVTDYLDDALDDGTRARFELHDLSLVTRIEVEDGRATGVTVEDLRTRESRFIPADLVVVAAAPLRHAA